jgi:hypothetical protein
MSRRNKPAITKLIMPSASPLLSNSPMVPSNLCETVARPKSPISMELPDRRHHNAQTPLCRLPVEILARILLFVRGSVTLFSDLYASDAFDCMLFQSGASRPSIKATMLEWTSVMSVCSRVREIALATPELWSVVDFTYWDRPQAMRWTYLCLQRSGETDLSIFNASFQRSDVGTHAYISRARHLWIQRDGLLDSDDLHNPLQSLRIQNTKLQTLVYEDSSECPFQVSPAFFGGCQDTLRILVLRHTRLIERIELPSLIRLELSEIRDGGDDHGSIIATILHIVSRAPHLEFLRLGLPLWAMRATGVLVEHDYDYESLLTQFPYISMPYFRVFIIHASAVDTYVLLHALPHPSQKLRVRVDLAPATMLPEHCEEALLDRIQQSAMSRSGITSTSTLFARAYVSGRARDAMIVLYTIDLDDDGRTHLTLRSNQTNIVKLLNSARIIYFGDDLHFLLSSLDPDTWFPNTQFIVFLEWDEARVGEGARFTAWLTHRARMVRRVVAVDVFDPRSEALTALAQGWKRDGLVDYLIIDGISAGEFARAEPYLGTVRDSHYRAAFGGGEWNDELMVAQRLRLCPPNQ